MDRNAFSWLGLAVPLVGLTLLLLTGGGPFTPPPLGTVQRAVHDFERAAQADDRDAIERLCAEEALEGALGAAALLRGDERWMWRHAWKVNTPDETTATFGRTVGSHALQLELERTESGWRIVRAATS